MNASVLRRWLWSVGVLLCAACSRGPGADLEPRPSRVVPSQGLSAGPVAVVIEGENFLALATQRLGSGPAVEVSSRFEARLGDTPLTDVVLEDSRHLRAVVPPGLKTGWYALTVVSPLGRAAVVPDAYFASEHAPARLEATARLELPAVAVGQQVRLVLDVSNLGETPALGVRPALDVTGDGQVTVVDAPSPGDVGPGLRVSFAWTLRAEASGDVHLAPRASGTDGAFGGPAVASAEPVPLSMWAPASLTASLVATPDPVNVGGRVRLSLTVMNTGQALARAVTPSAPSVISGAAALVSGPTPASLDVAGGASAVFSWDYQAGAEGPLSFKASAAGQDGNSGAGVSAPEVESRPVTVQRPATLVGTLSVPAKLNVGQTVTFVLTVRNTGASAASAVRPVALGFAGPGSVQSCAAPVPVSEDIPGGEARDFRCQVKGQLDGSITFTAGASGTDALDGRAVSMTPVGRTVLIQRPALLTATQLSAPAQAVVGGPFPVTLLVTNTGGVDALNVTPEALGLSDAAGLVVLDGPTPPAVKLPGGIGQVFTWRVVASREGTFRFTGGAHGQDANDASASLAAGPLTSNDVVVHEVPPLAADRMPGLGSNGAPANTAFNDALYMVNNGGCVRSTTSAPRPYDTHPGDWAPCTPSLPAWTSHTSVPPSKTADLEPGDKAVPRLAVFGGRLYLARDTTGGPQLFMCTPEQEGDAAQCDPGDWTLVAPNTRGDTQLTQFDDANNTSLALLAATSSHLYLGYNNAAEGLVLLRSEGTAPATQADFRGAGGCAASQLSSGCAGLGGNGLGAGATRFLDGVALTVDGTDFVYVIAGDGSNPVRLFRVAD